MEDIKFNELRIYEDIYDIFESELVDIGKYISFTDENLKTYSNKIHELHLRVCSEVENMLKVVVHNNFVDKDKIREAYPTKKKNLDFEYYLSVACTEFNLNKKIVKFKGAAAFGQQLDEIQPFNIKADDKVPEWWTAYNKLKHDKLANFNKCTLGDLINSLAGLYILMTYRKQYRKNNPPIEYQNYWIDHPVGNIGGNEYWKYWEIPSKLFSATFYSDISSFINLRDIPVIISEQQYQSIRAGIGQGIEEMNVPGVNFEKMPKHARKEHCIFQDYFDYRQVANFDIKNMPVPLVPEKHFARQKTRFAKFVN